MAKNVRVACVCLFSALGSFLFGLDMGYIGPIIEDDEFKRDVARLADWDDADSEIGGATSGFIVSVFSLGCMFSAFPLVSSCFLDVLGRKVSVMVGAVVFILGAVVQGTADSVVHMVVGRFVSGCSIGILSTVVPLYQSEVAPPSLRGALTAVSQVMICFGIVVAALADQLLLRLEQGWRWAVLLPVVPGLVLFVGMIFLPRSPRWLVHRGRPDEALLVLQGLREEAEAAAELKEIVADQEGAKSLGEPRWAELFSGRVARLLAVGMALQLLQQLTGINAFVSYGPRIFKSLGFSANLFQTLSNAALFLATVPALYLVERFGRRSLLVCGAIGMMVPNLLMGAVGLLCTRADHEGGVDVSSHAAGTAMVAASFIFLVNFAYSWGPTTWVYCAEIFPLRFRGRCVGLTTMAEWSGVFLVNQFTPMLLGTIGFGAFFIFGGFALVATLLALWLPETKGVLLEHMDQVFDARFGVKMVDARCGGADGAAPGGRLSGGSGSAPGVGAPCTGFGGGAHSGEPAADGAAAA